MKCLSSQAFPRATPNIVKSSSSFNIFVKSYAHKRKGGTRSIHDSYRRSFETEVRVSALRGVGVFFSGIVLELQRLLADWDPGALQAERHYQESLFNFLQAQLPDCVIRREYPEGGSIIDIYLRRPGFLSDEEVFFELKHHLTDNNEYKRLLGQLMEMKPKQRKIIVVLCGNSDRSMVQRLREHFKDHLNDDYTVLNTSMADEPQMAVVVKQHGP